MPYSNLVIRILTRRLSGLTLIHKFEPHILYSGRQNSGRDTSSSKIYMQVLDHDMDEEELRDVLLEAMHNMMDAPIADEESGPKGISASGSVAGGFFARKLKRKGGAAKLSSEELGAAAHWLIERFGQEGDDESDEEDAAHEELKRDAAGEEEEEVRFLVFFSMSSVCVSTS